MQIVSLGDNLHEMSNPIFCDKSENYFTNLLSAVFGQRVLKFKTFWIFGYC